MKFAITGVAGFVAPRHLKAITATGHKLVAALDPHDSVGVLDRCGTDVDFFTETERFERHLRRLQREKRGIDWLSVCSPNHLHDAHACLGMYVGANVICEKPLVLSPWNLDELAEVERATGKRVHTVLQLRTLPAIQAFKASRVAAGNPFDEVEIDYVTPRGQWYHRSWKGDEARSGGVVANIGIHLLDLMLWLFGPCQRFELGQLTESRAQGVLHLEKARVVWRLSLDARDLVEGEPARRMLVNGKPLAFEGFEDAHTKLYEETLAGRGFGIDDARPAVELAYKLRRESHGA